MSLVRYHNKIITLYFQEVSLVLSNIHYERMEAPLKISISATEPCRRPISTSHHLPRAIRTGTESTTSALNKYKFVLIALSVCFVHWQRSCPLYCS